MSSPSRENRREGRETFAARQLCRLRLRSNSGAVIPQDTGDLSPAERNSVAPPAPLYKVVLTGGPCGGKTTALARLSPYLRERGFEVITCPEAFSILVSNGMAFDYFGAVEGMDIIVQDTVMDIQIGLEDGFERVLRARGKPAVLLCDRGLMDGSAYMSPEKWDALLEKREVESVADLREGRYNAVFHLITAAEGAEKYYTLDNNEVRTETPEVARALDHLTRKAWVGHPNLTIFDNSTNFEKKIQRVVNEISRLVGLPSHLERKTTKFLLSREPDLDSFPEDVDYKIFDVEKVYLFEEKSNDENIVQQYSFARKRTSLKKAGEPCGAVYGLTIVQKTVDGQKIEKKRIITKREYISLFNNRDKSRHVIKEKRIFFLWKGQSFAVHAYKEPVSDIMILHAQRVRPSSPDIKSLGTDIAIPTFLDVVRPITDSKEDEKYGAYFISLKK